MALLVLKQSVVIVVIVGSKNMISVPRYIDKLTGDLVQVVGDPRGSDNTVSCKVVGGDPNVFYRCPLHRLSSTKPYLISEGERFIVTPWKHHIKVETFPDDEDQMMSRIWMTDGGFLPAGWVTLKIVLPVIGSMRTFNLASSAEGSFVNLMDLPD